MAKEQNDKAKFKIGKWPQRHKDTKKRQKTEDRGQKSEDRGQKSVREIRVSGDQVAGHQESRISGD